MKYSIKLSKAEDLILEKAVKIGMARTKEDALRFGIFVLNQEHGIIKDFDAALQDAQTHRRTTKKKAKLKFS